MNPFAKPPKYLYKYLPFNKRTIKSLKNQLFWFSDSETFNDLHDCKIKYDFTNTYEEVEKHFHKTNQFYTNHIKSLNDSNQKIDFIIQMYGNQLSQNLAVQISDGISNNNKQLYTQEFINQRLLAFQDDPHTFIESLKSASLKMIRDFRIFCLCNTKKCATMWAHYSDNHKGVCLKFEVMKDENFFNFPLKVMYKNKYPIINYIREWDSHNSFFAMVSTKSTNWKYEQEYRIVKDKAKFNFLNEGLYKIKKEAIIEVNFGIKAKDEDIKLFKEINKKIFDNKIKILKAREIDQSFDLGFDRIY